MSKIKTLLSANTGKIYVYLAAEDICKHFFEEAEKEGFTFGDGVRPTQKHTSDIIAVNDDMTINYVGFIGHIAFQAANKIDSQPLIKIDYRKILQSQ